MRLIIMLLLGFSSLKMMAQSDKFTLQQAIGQALKNNLSIKASEFEVESQKQLKKTGFDLPKTDITLLYGQYNSYTKNDNNISISQAIPFSALVGTASLNLSLLKASELKKANSENELVYQVKQVYYQLVYTQAQHSLLLQQDSLFEGFYKSASKRYNSGESNLLEKTTAETQRNEVMNQMRNNEATILALRIQLKTLLNSEAMPDIDSESSNQLTFNSLLDSSAIQNNPSLDLMRQRVVVAKNQKKLEAAKFAPDLLVGFFSQTLIGADNPNNAEIATTQNRFTGFQLGISVPLWFAPHQGRVKAADYSQKASESNYQYYQKALDGRFQEAIQQCTKNKNSLEYYRSSALPNAQLILIQSKTAFNKGEINYPEYLLGVRNALIIQEAYLQSLNDYNQSIIYLEFLSGNK